VNRAGIGGPKVRLDPNASLDLRWLGSDRGERAIRFIQRYCRLVKGKSAGKLVRLRPWQKEIVRGVFAPGVRQAYVSMARKNGKSFLAAAMGLYALCGDGEQGAEVYCVAGDERQARVAWNLARRMVELDERLSSVIQVYADRLVHEPSDSIFEPLPADAELRLGLNPSFVVFDEVAIQPSDDLWLAMQLAMGAREHPVLVGITTPGWSKDSLAWRLSEHGRRGEDDSFFFWERAADDGCDVHDEKQWKKANPALLDWLLISDMRATVKSAPEHDFRRFRLGQWTEGAQAWLPFGRWEQLADPDRVVEGPVTLFFDGSASGDASALCYATIEEKPHVGVVDVWENTGDPNWRVPRQDVAATVEDVMERWDVRELGCDPWGWRTEIEQWAERWGAEKVLEIPSNVRSRAGPAVDRFFTLVMEGKLTHDGDPRLARHIANATPKVTAQGTQLQKPSNAQKIDSAVASVFAVDRAAFHLANPKKKYRTLVVA
jgi:phage terminase large subunit-like protein